MNNIQPSLPRVSMLLDRLLHYSNDIDDTLLIGEQVQMIQEAGELYNEIRQLVTPEYFTDVEYNWLKQIGNSWTLQKDSTMHLMILWTITTTRITTHYERTNKH